jgi:hypothetical protein
MGGGGGDDEETTTLESRLSDEITTATILLPSVACD